MNSNNPKCLNITLFVITPSNIMKTLAIKLQTYLIKFRIKCNTMHKLMPDHRYIYVYKFQCWIYQLYCLHTHQLSRINSCKCSSESENSFIDIYVFEPETSWSSVAYDTR